MKFKDIAKRLTGFSTPFFGVSWEPPTGERAIARWVITFLEDRRVLYSPSEVEVPEHCARSVVEIRRFLTECECLHECKEESSVAQAVRAMGAAGRKFLNRTGAKDPYDILRFGAADGHYASWVFGNALGEMHGVFGAHIARLAAAYGVDVESELAAVLPAEYQESGKESA